MSFILWSLVGLFAGLVFGNLMGFEGRELVFPGILGCVLVGVFAYKRLIDLPAVELISENMEDTASGDGVQNETAVTAAATTEQSSSPPKKMGKIDDVIVTPLKTFPDDRGYFREIFRLVDAPIDEAAQVSATMSYPGVVKAFHYHNNQDDLWYCAKGMIHAVMYDRRPDSRTYGTTQVVAMGDLNPQTLFIPRGVVHGYEVLGPEAALVIYATTQVYDPNDELRIPHDDKEIGYNWGIKPR